jgi:hypothetical protein
MPDAFRLCSSFIPDPASVEQCLRQNKSDLSDACRSVFEQSAGPVVSRSKQRNGPCHGCAAQVHAAETPCGPTRR